jgi:hypothetical protein
MTLATTLPRVDSSEEILELKAIVAEQQQRLDNLEKLQDAKADDSPTRQSRATRRQMLKLAGATLLGAAGSAALQAVPAAANNGQTMVVGTLANQDLSNETGISIVGSAAPGNVFAVFTSGSTATYQRALVGYANTVGSKGVVGYASTNNGIGVYAYSYSSSTTAVGMWSYTGTPVALRASSFGNTAIIANTSAVGGRSLYAYSSVTNSVPIQAKSTVNASAALLAGATNSAAILAYNTSTQSPAIQAITYSYTQPAVGAGSLGGPDVKLGGTGRLLQAANISGGIGAPSFTPSSGHNVFHHSYFELVRADDGAIWASRGTGTLKSAWKRVNAVRVDAASGSGAAFKPVRIVDTRNGTGGVTGPIAGGVTTTFMVAGGGGGTIPSDAIAVVGNITATGWNTNGWLTIHPTGVPYNPNADPSTMNFSGTAYAWANSFVVGLGTGASAGKVDVYVGILGSGHSNFIIDITGYIQ